MFRYESKLDFWVTFKYSKGGYVTILLSKIEGYNDTSVFTTGGHEFKDLVDIERTMSSVIEQTEEYLTKKQ